MLKEKQTNEKRKLNAIKEFEQATNFKFYNCDNLGYYFEKEKNENESYFLQIFERSQRVKLHLITKDSDQIKGLDFELLQPLSNLINNLGFEKVEE